MVEEEMRGSAAGNQPEADAGPQCSAADFNPELAEILYRSLGPWLRLGSGQLESELRALEKTYRAAVYSELIYLLSHLRFPGSQAKSHWQAIDQHRRELEQKLGSFVDARVALASYFVHVNRKIQDPRIVELQLFEQSRTHAYRDELTSLPNHRFFVESLDREMLRARRSNQPMSLVMADIDDFRRYNERHGHRAGDVVLTEVARLLTASLRDEDIVARHGGEEFALILPSTPKAGAQLVAERTRAAIEARDIPHDGLASQGRVTVSMGIATFPGDADDASGLVRCADRALYLAKSGGKNQVAIHGGNRRSFSRVDVRLRGQCRPLSRSARPITTMNLSEGGIRFVAEQELAAGSLVEVLLDMPSGTPQVAVVARVVQALQSGDGAWETSARIVAIETEDRLAYHRYIGEMRHRTGDDAPEPG
jgi:diguanylate cyclase (GGDEF)-like protein